MSEETPVEGRKNHKKKGKSFIQKAKKFGRQGQRGKGTEIEQDQYDYLVRVMERWRDGFETDEEKQVFVENVFEQTVGEERNLCGNQLASRVIEMLLPSADTKVIGRLSSSLGTDLRLVCMDPFMSHVLEKLLLLRSFTVPGGISQVDLEEDKDWVLKVCKFVVNNLEDFCQDTYASHLLRTATQCLSGRRYPTEAPRRDQPNKQTEGYDKLTEARLPTTSDPEFGEVLDTLTSRVLGLEGELLGLELCVRVLQVFIKVVGVKSLVRKVVKHLLASCYTEDRVDWDDTASVRLFETIVEVGINSEKLSKKIFSIVDSKFMELAVHPTANFVVQRVLEHLEDKEKFSTLVTDLCDQLEPVLSAGCTGVLLGLTKAAVRLETGQSTVLASISQALHCSDGEAGPLAPALAHMVTREAMGETDKVLSVHLHGSLALQQLLLFNKPIKVVRSMLAMSPAQLASLLGDPRGCHVTDSFMSSKTVGEKSREALVRGLRGEMGGLACSKHGSRSVDCLWRFSSLKMRQVMVEDMTGKLDMLSSNKFGKFVAQNCMVAVFKRSKDDWKKLIEKGDKTENLFSDIIGETEVKSLKRKAVTDTNVSPPEVVEVAEKVVKKDVSAIVDEWLKSGDDAKPAKKKKKAKSYLDDL